MAKKIDNCYKCEHLHPLGNACMLELRNLSFPNLEIPDWCPLEDETEEEL